MPIHIIQNLIKSDTNYSTLCILRLIEITHRRRRIYWWS